MKSRKSILALGAFFVLAAGLSACGSGIPGNAVADVAGNPITTTAFNHWMLVAAKGNTLQSPGSPVIVPTDPPDFNNCIAQVRKQIPTLAKTSNAQLKSDCNQLFRSLGSQVMDFLIKTYWYQADAAKGHISVTEAQVQQAFTAAKAQQFPTPAALQTYLSQTGQTMQDVLYRVRLSQIFRKLSARHSSSVSAAQIQTYYNAHRSQFGMPETRDIRIIRTNSQSQALAAKAALAGGQSWSAAAKQYSVDSSTKSSGGLLTGVTKGQEEKALDTAAFSAPTNKLLGPIQGTFGFYVIEVTKIKGSTQQTLAQATPQIQQTLASQAQTHATAAVEAQARTNWLHKTLCRGSYAISDCSGYKAPTTSTTTSPAQTAPSTTPTQTTPTPSPTPSTTTG